MLLGNKCDMTDKRMVARERGEQIAQEHKIRFLETSAKENINVDKAFYDLAESILNKVVLDLDRLMNHIYVPDAHRKRRQWQCAHLADGQPTTTARLVLLFVLLIVRVCVPLHVH